MLVFKTRLLVLSFEKNALIFESFFVLKKDLRRRVAWGKYLRYLFSFVYSAGSWVNLEDEGLSAVLEEFSLGTVDLDIGFLGDGSIFILLYNLSLIINKYQQSKIWWH